jgi:hypothetical protein
MEQSVGRLLPGLDQRKTPVSDHLFVKLREPLREYLPRDEDYQKAFDRFEYLLGLVHADLNRLEWKPGCWWGPVGCFIWRSAYEGGGISETISAEIEAEGADWAPLKAGLFGGSVEQAKTAKAHFDAFLKEVPI